MVAKTDEWLSREDIDRVVDSLSGADLIEGLADGANKTDAKISTVAFDTAAARLQRQDGTKFSNGTPASQHVRASDYRYLTKRVSEVISADSPLPEGQTD